MKNDEQAYTILDAGFWNRLWSSGHIGWDIGQVSPPIAEYFLQYQNTDAAIFIPGCGNAYEAEYLVSIGFQNITLLDISSEAVTILKDKFKSMPQVKVLFGDFFMHEGQYDVIVEQTFFCTHAPQRREAFMNKLSTLLKPNGRWVGVLFGIPLGVGQPPFGGNAEEYSKVFEPLFQIRTLAPCYNSYPSRSGQELFFNIQKKS